MGPGPRFLPCGDGTVCGFARGGAGMEEKRAGEADCHTSDIGHWFAMTELRSVRSARAADSRPYGGDGFARGPPSVSRLPGDRRLPPPPAGEARAWVQINETGRIVMRPYGGGRTVLCSGDSRIARGFAWA